MNSIKVSIVLPTYNGEKYIRQSIDSCLNQTSKNIELIIIDNGSTDSTPQIVAGYHDERIKYVRLEKNMGLPFALNTGFKSSTGGYLTWTSDDNYYNEKAVAEMVDFLQSNEKIYFVYANYGTVNENGDVISMVNVEPPKKLREHNCVGSCFLYRRKVYDMVGYYNVNLPLVEDYEYWVRIFKKFKMQKLNKFLYWHRIHPDSLTAQYADEARNRAREIRRQYFKAYVICQCFLNVLLLPLRIVKKTIK